MFRQILFFSNQFVQFSLQKLSLTVGLLSIFLDNLQHLLNSVSFLFDVCPSWVDIMSGFFC